MICRVFALGSNLFTLNTNNKNKLLVLLYYIIDTTNLGPIDEANNFSLKSR